MTEWCRGMRLEVGARKDEGLPLLRSDAPGRHHSLRVRYRVSAPRGMHDADLRS